MSSPLSFAFADLAVRLGGLWENFPDEIVA